MQAFEYEEITSAIERLGMVADAAECHGTITAIACMSGANGFKLWIDSYLGGLQDKIDEGDALAGETFDLMRNLYMSVIGQLQQGEFSFALLLPDDEVDLEIRTEAMAHWCQGFLMGLGYAGVSDFSKFSGELGEIIADITEISQVSAGQLEYSEEEEQSFTELVEYLRVGVMLFNETLNSQLRENSQSIH